MKAIRNITEEISVLHGYIISIREDEIKGYVSAAFREDTEDKERKLISFMCFDNQKENENIKLIDIVKRCQGRYVVAICKKRINPNKGNYMYILQQIFTFPEDNDI